MTIADKVIFYIFHLEVIFLHANIILFEQLRRLIGVCLCTFLYGTTLTYSIAASVRNFLCAIHRKCSDSMQFVMQYADIL